MWRLQKFNSNFSQVLPPVQRNFSEIFRIWFFHSHAFVRFVFDLVCLHSTYTRTQRSSQLNELEPQRTQRNCVAAKCSTRKSLHNIYPESSAYILESFKKIWSWVDDKNRWQHKNASKNSGRMGGEIIHRNNLRNWWLEQMIHVAYECCDIYIFIEETSHTHTHTHTRTHPKLHKTHSKKETSYDVCVNCSP